MPWTIEDTGNAAGEILMENNTLFGSIMGKASMPGQTAFLRFRRGVVSAGSFDERRTPQADAE